MKIIDYMKKNKDKTFVFVRLDGYTDGDDHRGKLNVDNSYIFGGYGGFVKFKSANRSKYKQIFKMWVNHEFDDGVVSYYLDASTVVFATMDLEGEYYQVKETFFEKEPFLVNFLKEWVQYSYLRYKGETMKPDGHKSANF